ncbi:hypothetical protein C8R45DRAFT_1056025 [Mycena sanguinolenta]|nr:hypothetical protein C8R45DRAFT_1056025 [Mycena sanguinolenta]
MSFAKFSAPIQVASVWEIQSSGKAVCLICKDGRERAAKNCAAHENTPAHQSLLAHRQNQDISEPALVDDGMRNLLSSLSGGSVDPYPAPHAPDPNLGIAWNLMTDDTDIPLSAAEQGIANIASAILHRYDEVPASDDEFEERSDDENYSVPEPVVPEFPSGTGMPSEEGQPRKRARATQDQQATNRFWYPWNDRITCTLDILMHLPRSAFSQRQLDLFLWLLKVNQVDDVPSVKSMQTLNATLQKMCGIDTIAYDGALGHKYYMNSLSQIIAQEMANPKVRPHLSFYPEDSGQKLSEARQGKRWLEELPDSQTTPMLRINQQDFFIHEPAMLRNGNCCIPTRWFTKNGSLFAKCWLLQAVTTDELSGWRVVIRSEPYVVAATEFLKNLPDFRADVESGFYNLPNPTNIIGEFQMQWTYTDPKVGNTWRAKAEGSRVVMFPLWMYCDDTSGNVSKKWNEHNSFLVTPAGLPRTESQKEYNIHFLSTSNIAPPLEMLNGVVDQLECQGTGKRNLGLGRCSQEPVLVIPEVLALLGDNPMQSEFACHIGLRGKLFCRACWVKGPDALDPDTSPATTGAADEGREEKKKAKESLEQMVRRVKDFIKVGVLRKKSETTEQLKSYFTQASTADTKTQIQNDRTKSGIKDTYQLVFLERLFQSYKGKRGRAAKQAALDACVARLPQNITSPVWRIKGLDPHQDTPVEILHVVLLGFLQLKNKDDKKELLITRLSSLDVSGPGISPLAGRTLVQYSGSLTGRDFRAIAQVAPFLVYDLVSAECFETWQSLSKLIPLIWQPEIENIDTHLVRPLIFFSVQRLKLKYQALLTQEIESFLLHTARWTNRWFNKPKFHIILHLPFHIRRFGPSILFATEAFESFNAIIRAKTLAFAQGNRIRHLLSGGMFLLTHPLTTDQYGSTSKFSKDPNAWSSIGLGPKYLVSSPSTVTGYLGLDNKKKAAQGNWPVCICETRLLTYAKTLTGQHIPAWSTKDGRFRTCEDLALNNGDICMPGSFIILKDPHVLGQTFVGRVEEIIQKVGSAASHASAPDGILIQKVTLPPGTHRYGMPRVILSGDRAIHQTADILCTVNVQHNCMDNKCGPTGSRPVFQERERTDQSRAQIVHSQNPTDLVLNTAQMRDARYLQRFRINTPQLDPETVIYQSAINEVAAQRNAAAEKPSGSGRRRSTASTGASRVESRDLSRLRDSASGML